MEKTVQINFYRHPDGTTSLKIGDRCERFTGKNFRRGVKFFNPTDSMVQKLMSVPHVTISSSNGESGWYQLWSLEATK